MQYKYQILSYVITLLWRIMFDLGLTHKIKLYTKNKVLKTLLEIHFKTEFQKGMHNLQYKCLLILQICLKICFLQLETETKNAYPFGTVWQRFIYFFNISLSLQTKNLHSKQQYNILPILTLTNGRGIAEMVESDCISTNWWLAKHVTCLNYMVIIYKVQFSFTHWK